MSQSAAFDVPSLLMTLDRYPYGCAEQTTSRAMPLLYVSELRQGAGLPEDPDLHGRIQDAIYRVLNYQSSTAASACGRRARATCGSIPTSPTS